MPTVSTDSLDDDLATKGIAHLVDLVTAEAALLAELLPEALAVQWQATPRLASPSSEAKRTEGAAPADPTADIALDGQRLAMRAQILRSEALLGRSAVALRGVRRGLERSLDRWHGDSDQVPARP